MSQLSQHNDGFDSQLQFFPQDSPTIGRNQVYNSPNPSSPISEPGKRYAKVYLELEHFIAFRVLTRDPSRSLRKAAPSPLQTSTTATSPPTSATPTRTTFPRGGIDHTSTSTSSNHAGPQEGPRSPKERLDDLLASEKTFYRSEDSSVDSIEENKSRCVPW
jgi:RalA-binding protein 1